jgi:hypothetical protein
MLKFGEGLMVRPLFLVIREVQYPLTSRAQTVHNDKRAGEETIAQFRILETAVKA